VIHLKDNEDIDTDEDNDDIFSVGNNHSKPRQDYDRVTESELRIINNYDRRSNYQSDDIEDKYYLLE